MFSFPSDLLDMKSPREIVMPRSVKEDTYSICWPFISIEKAGGLFLREMSMVFIFVLSIIFDPGTYLSMLGRQ